MFTADSIKTFFDVIGYSVDVHQTKKNYILKLNMVGNKPLKYFCNLNKNYTYHIPSNIGSQYGDDAVWTILLMKFCENLDVKIMKYVCCFKLSDKFNIFNFLKIGGIKYLNNLFYVYNANFGNPYKYTYEFLQDHTGIPKDCWNEKYVGRYWGALY